MRLPEVKEQDRKQGTSKNADGKHSERQSCFPALFKGIESHGGLWAVWLSALPVLGPVSVLGRRTNEGDELRGLED